MGGAVKAAVVVAAAWIGMAVCSMGAIDASAAASPRYTETWNSQDAHSARAGRGPHKVQARPVAAHRGGVPRRHGKVRAGTHAHAAHVTHVTHVTQAAHNSHERGPHVEKHASRLRSHARAQRHGTSTARHAFVAPRGHHAGSKTARTSAKRDARRAPHGKPKLVVQTRPSHAPGAGKPPTRELPPILS
jgi:hypothetical protein